MKTDQEKIDNALDSCDMDCEGENFHDRVGLAKKVFDAVKEFVTPQQHISLAKEIRKAISP